MKGVKNLFYAGLVALVMNLSCEKPVEPEEEEDPIVNPVNPADLAIYDNVYVLSQSDLNQIQSYDYSTISFSSPQEFSNGDIISGGISNKTPYGILNEITWASPDKKTFKVDMYTPLDEAVYDAEGSVSKELTYDDLKSASNEPGMELKQGMGNYNFHVDINKIIYDADGNNNTTLDQILLQGYSDFNIYTNTRIGVNHGDVYVRFESFLKGDSELELITGLPSINLNNKIPLQEYYFSPIVFAIGPVPVVIAPVAGLYFNYNLDLESQLEIGASNHFESKTILLRQDGDWSLTKDPENFFYFGFSGAEINFDANAGISLSPEVSLKLYYIAGPYANVEGYFNFNASNTANPWWTFTGGFNANIGIDMKKISKRINNFERTIPLIEERIIADAGGPFTGSGGDLDSLVIQPGPEGNDAWIEFARVAFPDCQNTQDFFSGFGDETYLDAFFANVSSCEFARRNILIKMPLDQISSEAISSAKLGFYGHTEMNLQNPESGFVLYKLKGDWEDGSVSWDNTPENEFIKYINFPNSEEDSWKSIDVTSTVRDWVEGEPNYGFEISSRVDHDRAVFYSGDNSNLEKRPKLVIYYVKQN